MSEGSRQWWWGEFGAAELEAQSESMALSRIPREDYHMTNQVRSPE